jgi:hypothetical protein
MSMNAKSLPNVFRKTSGKERPETSLLCGAESAWGRLTGIIRGSITGPGALMALYKAASSHLSKTDICSNN